MSNDTHRQTFERLHGALFSQSRYEAEFFNYSAGTWDPDNDEMTGETKSSIGSTTVEIVPPAQDSTIDLQGTDIDWSTSIRFPNTASDLVVKSGETHTVPSGETEIYNTVTVESNATLTIEGRIIAKKVTNNGTINVNGTLSVFGGSGKNPLITNINTLGVDNERPTQVEITDQKDGTKETFELHSYTTEIGSGMIMCRLVD